MNSDAPSRIFIREQARQDLMEIYAYLLERSELAGERLLNEARATFELIAQNPGVGRSWASAHSKLAGIRVTSISKRFRNYLIFYRPVRNGVEIVTILHVARDLSRFIDQIESDID